MSKPVQFTITNAWEWVEETRRRVFRARCFRCNRNVVESFDQARCRYLIREHIKQGHR